MYYIVSDWVDESSFRRTRPASATAASRPAAPLRTAGSMSTMDVLAPYRVGCRMTGARVQVLLFAAAPEDPDAVREAVPGDQPAGWWTSPVCWATTLLERTDEPGRFVVVSEWRSLDAFLACERSPGHRPATAALRRTTIDDRCLVRCLPGGGGVPRLKPRRRAVSIREGSEVDAAFPGGPGPGASTAAPARVRRPPWWAPTASSVSTWPSAARDRCGDGRIHQAAELCWPAEGPTGRSDRHRLLPGQ